MRYKTILAGIIASFLILAAISAVSAWNPPPKTIDFRGFVYIDGSPAPDGTVIEILAEDDLEMDSETLKYGNGYFNDLNIVWDDPSTPEDEGITYDTTTLEEIEFEVNEDYPSNLEYFTVKSTDEGATFDVVLDFPSGYPAEEEYEEGAPSQAAPVPVIEKCSEDWKCTEWEPTGCPDSGVQTRICRDANQCSTNEDKPDESRGCVFVSPPTIVEAKIPFVEAPVVIPKDVAVFILSLGGALVAAVMILILWELRKIFLESASIEAIRKRLDKIERKHRGK